jgi:flagellar hook-associated protein 1 FlgK
VVSVGTQNLSLTLQNPTVHQSFQVLTRDGRHVLGQPLSADEQALLIKPGNGIEAGATYSADHLNASGASTYLDMDIFMGAKAEVGLVQQFNTTTGDLLSPQKTPAVLTGNTFVPSSAGIAAGALTLNGRDLPALAGPLTLSAVVNWSTGPVTCQHQHDR